MKVSIYIALSLIFTSSSFISCQETQYVQGKQIYDAVCANCHMENGQGLGTLFPPIANSDYIVNNWDEIACIIKKGIKGEITVNGIKYNELMPAHDKLTEAEITNLLNYINSMWYDKNKTIKITDIKEQLSKCKEF